MSQEQYQVLQQYDHKVDETALFSASHTIEYHCDILTPIVDFSIVYVTMYVMVLLVWMAFHYFY